MRRSRMKALLNFNGDGASELQEEPEAKDEITEVHDILVDRLKRIANLSLDDKNFQAEIIKARAVSELAEVTIKHGMFAVAVSKLATQTNIKLPKFLLE
jgi:hypothetical protein